MRKRNSRLPAGLGLRRRPHRGRGQRSSINGEITCQLLVYLAVRLQIEQTPQEVPFAGVSQLLGNLQFGVEAGQMVARDQRGGLRRRVRKNAQAERGNDLSGTANRLKVVTFRDDALQGRLGLDPGPPESLRCRFSDDIAGTAEIGNRLLDGRGQLRSRGGLARLGADRVGHLAEALSGSHKHNPNE